MSEATPATPGPGARRRSGPRPGHTQSRKDILDRARAAFAANGYGGTSLRGVAREAGVDPSLVVHFFGSKAGLFAAVVQWPFDSPDAADAAGVPVDALGEYTARRFLENWEREDHRQSIISHIQAALADPTAAALLREFITLNFTLPIVQQGGADQPELRAALVSAQLMGVGLARYALGFEALSQTPVEQLTLALAGTLQRIITGPLTPLSPPDRPG